jgi:hypothetical protein
MHRLVMAGVLGVSLLAALSAVAERDLAQFKGRQSIGLAPNVPAALLSARLNITTIKKTRPARVNFASTEALSLQASPLSRSPTLSRAKFQ